MFLKKVYKKIDNVDIVSFDIFDTLLVRLTRSPKEVFDLLEKDFEKKFGYKKNVMTDRINAESIARFKSHSEEILFDDIYVEMKKYTNIEVEWLKVHELELEKSLLKVNPRIKPIYDYCKLNHKKIIIESDMYLSRDYIEKVLYENDLEYDELYLSSELNKTKRMGTMFEYMLEKESVTPKKILHIGDSIKSDYLMAKKHKINSLLIYKKRYVMKQINANKFDKLIQDKIEKPVNLYEKIGYSILGPLYLGFSNWLLNNLEKNKIERVFFLSRDGYVMKKAFDKINTGNINSKYLYVSRKGLVVPALYYFNSMDEMLDLTNIEVLKNITYELFLNKIGLSSDVCKEELKKMKISGNTILHGDKLRYNEKFKQFYLLIRKKMIYNSKIRLEELLAYLEKCEFRGKLAIVDIGWQGTMQKSIELILKKANIPVEIYGYYIGIKQNGFDNYQKYKMCGYVFDPIKNDNENKLFSFGGLFEYFYSTYDGSVSHYMYGKPVLDENEYKNSKYLDIMTKIQDGGLVYLSYASKMYDYYKLENFDEYCISKLIKFGTKPKLEYLNAFEDLYYSNLQNFYLLPQHSLLYYLKHLKHLKSDLNQSFWKVGFLKKLLILPLPYYKIYSLLKKR